MLQPAQVGLEEGAQRQFHSERLPVHGAAQGFLAGRSIATHPAAHADSKTVLKMDVKEFFPTVTLRRVSIETIEVGTADGSPKGPS